MKVSVLLLIITSILFGCSSHKDPAGGSAPTGPRLVLSAQPRQGLAPHRATIRANLEGVGENDSEWYCLKEEWDFGDGTVSTEEEECDPFTPETKVTTNFFADHTYDDAGHYTVRFKLGDNKLRSNQITVVVLEGRLEDQVGAKLNQ